MIVELLTEELTGMDVAAFLEQPLVLLSMISSAPLTASSMAEREPERLQWCIWCPKSIQPGAADQEQTQLAAYL